MKFSFRKVLPLLMSVFVLSCGKPQTDEKKFSECKENKILKIELAGKAASDEAEISSLAKAGRDIILIPQFPYKFSNIKDGIIWKIPESRIEDYISGKNRNKIVPEEIVIEAKGFDDIIRRPGGGIEAMVFNGSSVFAVIEYVRADSSFSYLIKGKYFSEEKRIVFIPYKKVRINTTYNIENLTVETLTFINDRIIAIPELNGKIIAGNPFASEFDRELNFIRKIEMPFIEYRITDATYINEDSTFYVTNYNYPGEEKIIKPDVDSIAQKFGIGKSHFGTKVLERIVKLKLNKDKIEICDEASLYIKLNSEKTGRNWEGIIEFGKDGFIIMTDFAPNTFAYIKK